MMKLLKAQKQVPNKIILEIDKIHYIKSMTPLPDLIRGKDLLNPIEVRKYSVLVSVDETVSNKWAIYAYNNLTKFGKDFKFKL